MLKQTKIKPWEVQNFPCELCKEYVEGVGFI